MDQVAEILHFALSYGAASIRVQQVKHMLGLGSYIVIWQDKRANSMLSEPSSIVAIEMAEGALIPMCTEEDAVALGRVVL